MKKIFLLVCIFFSAIIFAQEEPKKETTTEINQPKQKSEFWDKVRFGGGFGLNFGNNFFTLALTPTAVYEINDQFSLGGGVGYRYTKNGDLKNNVFSLSALGLYNPIQQLQLSSEFEQLFVNQKLDSFKNSYNYPALYLGIAYRVGRFSTIGINYDVLYDENKSIYSSPITPIIRIFF